MTTQNTPANLDPTLFDKLRDIFARPDMVDYCRRAAAPAQHPTRRAYQDTDFRSWKE